MTTLDAESPEKRKKRVLFFIAPSYCLVTGYKIKSLAHRFVGSAPKLLASALDPNLFEVDLFDFDAKLSRHFEPIEDCITELPELYYPSPFVEYLKGERQNPKIDEILETIDEGFEGYDYILCSNPRNPLYEIPVFAGNNLTLIIMQYLARKNPGAEKVYGGIRSQYFDWDELRQHGVDLKELVDVAVFGKIPYQSINGLLLNREVVQSEFFDPNGRYKKIPLIGKMAAPPLDYSPPRDVLRNREDLKYSYQRIFDDLMLELPVKEKASSYILQAGMYYIGGCIAKCAFCSTGVNPPMFDSLQHTQDVIKAYIDLGYNSFFFKNATLNSNRKLTESLCNWIVRENIKIQWSDSCRLAGNGRDFYRMLYEAGARMLCYGVDSGSDRMLKYVQKGMTAEMMADDLREAHEAGIWNLVNVIAGYPFETREDIDLTVQFLKDNLKHINIFKFNPFHMENRSAFSLTPEKFNLRLVDEFGEEHRKYESLRTDEIRYDEVGGRSWAETVAFRKYVRERIRETHPFRVDKFMTHIGQHLLFALYDMLGNKAAVEAWLFENYRKGRAAYYEKYRNHAKIEPWESQFDLYPNFQGKEDDTYIFKSRVQCSGHTKLGDYV